MATAPAKRSDLVEVAHPGFKTVYHSTDRNGRAVVVPYVMPDIDANDCVVRYPDMYSFKVPEGAGELQPAVSTHDPFSNVPTFSSQAVGGADTSIGHGNPAAGAAPDAQEMRRLQSELAAANAEIARLSGGKDGDAKRLQGDVDAAKTDLDKANADLEAAQGKDDGRATAKAQLVADQAKARLADAQAKLDAAKT